MAQSGFQTPITVKTLIDGIENRNYFLPSIQREFVWNTDRIAKLFDSLMRGYPIGSFLFWEVPDDGATKYQFYEFIRKYHERDRKHNDPANLTGNTKKFQAILDGQQRMNSLYIGLKGSYAAKLRYKSKNSSDAYPEKELYLNILDIPNDLDRDMMYDFKFLTNNESKIRDDKHFWFKVGDILDNKFDNPAWDIAQYLMSNNINNPDAGKILSMLHHQIINQPLINYYLETTDDLDKVVNIFIRVNSGGMILNPSDLLLSFATANLHGKRDVRKEIYSFVELLNDIGGQDNFATDKDFVLKALLVLTPEITNIKFKVSNFDKDKMSAVDKNWDKIFKAVELAVMLIDEYGFSKDDFKSNNSIIPIAQYIFNNNNDTDNYANDKAAMMHWFIAANIKGTFGASTDEKLTTLRNTLNENINNFPLKAMLGNDFKNNLIDTIINLEYKDTATLMALHILCPHVDLKNKFHVDHIFPKSKFTTSTLASYGITNTEAIKFYYDNCNSIANLQLLPGNKNQSKSDKFFDDWINEEFDGKPEELQHYKLQNCIPDVDLSFGNFRQFIEERETLIRQKLEQNLKEWGVI